MSLRHQYRQVGELVWQCAQTMRMMTRAELGSVRDCPFKAQVMLLGDISRQIETIADHLPARWDLELGGPPRPTSA